jgi:hypothetical protein
MRATSPKTTKKPPPDVVFVVVDRSDLFSHSVHMTEAEARREARQATRMWWMYEDRGPFQVVKYFREVK